jgi:hypothetical protein
MNCFSVKTCKPVFKTLSNVSIKDTGMKKGHKVQTLMGNLLQYIERWITTGYLQQNQSQLQCCR